MSAVYPFNLASGIGVFPSLCVEAVPNHDEVSTSIGNVRGRQTPTAGQLSCQFIKRTVFVVSELAGNFLSSQLGTVLGVIGTGALVFFLQPIQRAAVRLWNAAMPNTHDTPEYESHCKLQFYETALQAAFEDGHISDRQRRVPDSMIGSMSIDAKISDQLETDARAALAR